MGRTVTIRFKDNKVCKISGAGSAKMAREAAAFGNAFVQQLKRASVKTAPTAAPDGTDSEEPKPR